MAWTVELDPRAKHELDQLDPQFGALPRDRGRLWLAVDGDGRLVEAA